MKIRLLFSLHFLQRVAVAGQYMLPLFQPWPSSLSLAFLGGLAPKLGFLPPLSESVLWGQVSSQLSLDITVPAGRLLSRKCPWP